MQFRAGREAYEEKYKRALELHKTGKSIAGIAAELGVSYSAAYHWIKGLRKPEAGNLRKFEAFLREHGPTPAANVKETFPKHNELYHTAAARSGTIRRHVLSNPRAFGELATWYYLAGQEAELKARIKVLLETLSKK
ncbi:MAG: helix-turn-helix domain-containing protein [Candidatus Aenigmatarchaeota archaeon]